MTRHRTRAAAALAALLLPAPLFALSFLIEPYLQYPTTTSMVICWRTDAVATSTVLVGPDPGQLTPVTGASAQQHEVVLPGLTPGALYYYKVQSQQGSAVVESAVATFRTSPDDSHFRFVFITDTQTDPAINQSFTDDILNFGPELLFHGGDHVDDGDDIDGEWLDYFRSSKDYLSKKPQFNVLGNHNYRTDPLGLGHDEAQTSLLLFAQPGNERWFTVRRGSVLFVVLDANQDRLNEVKTVEPGWLLGVLQDATDGVDDPLLKVAVFHQPAFSSGIHTMEFPNVEFDDEFVLAEFVPLFEQYGVDLVLNGHEHFYERSRKAGIVYLICGSAGGSTRGQVGSNLYSEYLVEYANSVFLAEADINRISLDVVRPDGSLIESVAVEVLAIRTEALPSATVATAYTADLDTSGGQLPYVYSLRSGSLPPGIALDTQLGRFFGTPTTAGSWSFRLEVRDATGATHARDLALTVSAVPSERLVTGPGPGASNPPRVRAFDGSGSPLVTSFLAYGTSAYGVGVAVGDVGTRAGDEVLTGPGPGAIFGPQVRGFGADGAPMGKVNFYAYGTLRFGANVASGSTDADGWDELLAGPGPGAVFGPHLRGFDVDGSGARPIPAINAFVYATLKFGLNPTAADVEGDGFAEILAGPGPGVVFGPHLRGFDVDGAALRAIAGINAFVFATNSHGCNVGAADVDADLLDEALAGKGPGPAFDSEVAAFDADGAGLVEVARGVAYAGGFYGARVGGGALGAAGGDLLVTAPGDDPAQPPLVRTWTIAGSALSPAASFDAYPGSGLGYGAKVGAGDLIP